MSNSHHLLSFPLLDSIATPHCINTIWNYVVCLVFFYLPPLQLSVSLLNVSYMKAGVLSVLFTLLSSRCRTWLTQNGHFLYIRSRGNIWLKTPVEYLLKSIVTKCNIYSDICLHTSLLFGCHSKGRWGSTVPPKQSIGNIFVLLYLKPVIKTKGGGLKHTNPIVFQKKNMYSNTFANVSPEISDFNE